MIEDEFQKDITVRYMESLTNRNCDNYSTQITLELILKENTNLKKEKIKLQDKIDTLRECAGCEGCSECDVCDVDEEE